MLFIFKGLDTTFGNFETKTKTELLLWAERVEMDDRCVDDSLMYVGKVESGYHSLSLFLSFP